MEQNKIPEKDIIYMAGFFDGEGCITVGAYKTNMKYDHRYIRIVTTIGQVESGLPILQLFNVHFGGYISKKRKPKNKNCQHWYQYFTRGKASKLLLTTLIPYLILKKAQAVIALKILDIEIKTYQENLIKEKWDLAKEFVEMRTGSIKAQSILDEYEKRFNDSDSELK